MLKIVQDDNNPMENTQQIRHFLHHAVLASFFFLISSFLFPVYGYLPNSAYTLPVSETIPVGSIIVETVEGYTASTGASDESFIGVLVEQADFVFRGDEDALATTRPVVSSGLVPMRLQNSTGQIVKGDFITFSKTEDGVGVEAQQEDIVIATALETVNGDSIQVKPVQISQTNTKGNLQSPKDNGVFAQELTNILQTTNSKLSSGETNPAIYLLAIIVVIIAAVFAFILFGRISINGITAIGRNPLAKGAIITGIVINSLLVIAFMLGTIIAAAYIVGW